MSDGYLCESDYQVIEEYLCDPDVRVEGSLCEPDCPVSDGYLCEPDYKLSVYLWNLIVK